MEIAEWLLWPLVSGPHRARWAAQALELYLHLARIVITCAATRPAAEQPFPPAAVDLARQLYEAIEGRLDEPGRLPSPDVLCARGGARLYFPYPPVPEEEAWPAICDTCGVTASGRWTSEVRLFDLGPERSA